MKHLPASRKKIHCLSLLQQDALLTTIQQCELYNELSNHIDMKEDYNWLEVIFSNVTLEDISQADVAICYYVSGYIARRIDNQRQCTSCKKSLISSNTSSEVTESLFEEALKAVQNGKPWQTCRASAFCFATTVFAMQFFNALASNAKNMKMLLTLNNA